MRCVKFLLALFLITFLFANCSQGDGSGGVVLKDGESTLLSFGPGGAWTYVIVYGPGKDVNNDGQGDGTGVITEDPTAQPAPEITGHVLVTGVLEHSAFNGGEFLVEARGTKSCGDSICADMEGKPSASTKVSQPGFFSLIIPKTDQAVYLVATYTDIQQISFNKSSYLGVLSGRVDDLVFDFSPEVEPSPTPAPTPSPGPGGPTDLVSN